MNEVKCNKVKGVRVGVSAKGQNALISFYLHKSTVFNKFLKSGW